MRTMLPDKAFLLLTFWIFWVPHRIPALFLYTTTCGHGLGTRSMQRSTPSRLWFFTRMFPTSFQVPFAGPEPTMRGTNLNISFCNSETSTPHSNHHSSAHLECRLVHSPDEDIGISYVRSAPLLLNFVNWVTMVQAVRVTLVQVTECLLCSTSSGSRMYEARTIGCCNADHRTRKTL